MSHSSVIVIGAGVTGITTAYALLRRGYDVTVVEQNRHAAGETSYANGGQLSACNAQVWNSWPTIWKGAKWMFDPRAPLLLNPAFSFQKYSWLAEFMLAVRHRRANTLETVRLAIAARRHLFDIARREHIDFDLEKRGILHLYNNAQAFKEAERGNRLLREGGLDRYAVTNQEIHSIEPSLVPEFYGGFFTPSDSTGDIRKFTRGLADACARQGVRFHFDVMVRGINNTDSGVSVQLADAAGNKLPPLDSDALVVCAGVGSRRLASMVGDRINIYPVKGYSITVCLEESENQQAAPWVSLLDDDAKIVTSRLGAERFRVAGTAEFNGYNKDIRADRIEPLLKWCHKLFPAMSTATVIPWAGLRPMTPSMMPRVGRGRRRGIYYNTGHGHLGWTLCAATAAAISDLVLQDITPRSLGLQPA
ncbi:MAG TPA: D-amino acid dehydrogenase [Steroidobacteraceae bacterium]